MSNTNFNETSVRRNRIGEFTNKNKTRIPHTKPANPNHTPPLRDAFGRPTDNMQPFLDAERQVNTIYDDPQYAHRIGISKRLKESDPHAYRIIQTVYNWHHAGHKDKHDAYTRFFNAIHDPDLYKTPLTDAQFTAISLMPDGNREQLAENTPLTMQRVEHLAHGLYGLEPEDQTHIIQSMCRNTATTDPQA